MNFAVLAIVAPLIFVAELPDKTALASLVLGARYRASWVFAGVAAGFAVHVVLAVAIGAVLGLLPHRLLESVVAAVFLIGAILLLRGQEEEETLEKGPDDAGFWRVAGMSFGVILVAEFGDLTQIVTANLAAKYHDPLSVGVGAVIGLWGVAAVAILGGRGLLRVLPMKWITRVAALVMFVMAVLSLIAAIRG